MAVAHVTPERLEAYDRDRLTPGEDDEIQEHFVRCRDCPEMFLDLKDFSRPRGGGEHLSESGLDWAWRSLRSRLRREARPALPAQPPARFRLAGWLLPPRGLAAACAVLLTATLGLSLWVAALRREQLRLDAPQANVLMASLVQGTRGPVARHEIEVPRYVDRIVLTLVSSVESAAPAYRLEIRAGEAEMWSQDGLVRGEDGAFTVELSRGFLPSGDYVLRVLDGARPLEEYRLHVSYR
jgi:hypothetical protein